MINDNPPSPFAYQPFHAAQAPALHVREMVFLKIGSFVLTKYCAEDKVMAV